jgi:hypothetical protein
MRRSTRLRRRYSSLLNGPCRFIFFRLGIVVRIPRLRKNWTTGWPQYPLSPTIRRGRLRGRPRPDRLTVPLSISAGICCDSAAWPGVSTKVIGLPPPSARTCTFVLNPPRLRPKASASAVVFLPQRHVDERERSSHPQSALPSRAPLADPLPPAKQPAPGPRCLPPASGKIGWRPYPIFHTGWVGHARVHRYGGSKVCH